MEDDKAPNPDGFPPLFFKVCWDVVGKDVLVVFQAFHDKDQWCKSLSATFITLIPKTKMAAFIKDFRLYTNYWLRLWLFAPSLLW